MRAIETEFAGAICDFTRWAIFRQYLSDSLLGKPNVETNHASKACRQNHSSNANCFSTYVVVDDGHDDVENAKTSKELPISFH
jgi:hypothetical protein